MNPVQYLQYIQCICSCVLGNQCNVCWPLTFWSTNLVLLPVSVSTKLCSRCLCSFSSSESSLSPEFPPSFWWISRCLLECLINMYTLSFYKTDEAITNFHTTTAIYSHHLFKIHIYILRIHYNGNQNLAGQQTEVIKLPWNPARWVFIDPLARLRVRV